MVHFLENHDEQRISSPEFAGDAKKGKPAMVVSTTLSTSPTLVYFGQEFGEPGELDAGFGKPTRTSIFDYVSVPSVRRWVNDKNFNGGQSTQEEKNLRDFYQRLLSFTVKSSALMGEFVEIHQYNREKSENYTNRVYSFLRFSGEEKLLILSNFDADNTYHFELEVPSNVVSKLGLTDGEIELKDMLYGGTNSLKIENGIAKVSIAIQPLESFIYKF